MKNYINLGISLLLAFFSQCVLAYKVVNVTNLADAMPPLAGDWAMEVTYVFESPVICDGSNCPPTIKTGQTIALSITNADDYARVKFTSPAYDYKGMTCHNYVELELPNNFGDKLILQDSAQSTAGSLYKTVCIREAKKLFIPN